MSPSIIRATSQNSDPLSLQEHIMTTTITRLYDTYEQARGAVRELEASGVPHGDISIIANNIEGRVRLEHAHPGASAGAAVGSVVGGTAGLLAGLGLLAIPGIGPVVAAG